MEVNIVSGEFKADPFSFLACLRASDPVYRTTLPDKTPVWLLARYDDVTTLLRDERFTKNRRSALPANRVEIWQPFATMFAVGLCALTVRSAFWTEHFFLH